MIGLIFRALNHGGKHVARHSHKVAPHVAKHAHKAVPHVVKHSAKAVPTVHYARVPSWIQKGKIYHRHVRAWLYGK